MIIESDFYFEVRKKCLENNKALIAELGAAIRENSDAYGIDKIKKEFVGRIYDDIFIDVMVYDDVADRWSCSSLKFEERVKKEIARLKKYTEKYRKFRRGA